LLYWKKQPEYSLQQIQKSVEEHDVDSFNKHVNIDSLVSRSVEQFLNMDNNVDINNEFANMFVKGIFDAVKPQMVSYLKDKINSYIENGPNKDDPKKSNNQMTNRLTSDFSNLDFKKISYVKKNGKMSTIGLLMHSNDFTSDVTLELKMKLVNDEYWQVTEISNLISFLEEMEQFKAAKLSEINKPITEKMQTYINIDLLKTSILDIDGQQKYVKFNTNINVLSKSTILEARCNLIVHGENNKIVKIPFKIDGKALQQTTQNMSFMSGSIPINSRDGKILDEIKSNVVSTIEIQSIKFPREKELKITDEYVPGMIASKSPL
jgi:hypothetical protein